MNKSYCIRGLLCLAFLLATSVFSANATTITFDPLPVFNDASFHLVPADGRYDEGGYRLRDRSGIVYVGTQHEGYANAGNSTAVWNNGGISGFRLTRLDNAEFVLHSVALSKLHLATAPAVVHIVGHLPFGRIFKRDVIVPNVAGAMTITFTPAWNRLVSVEFNVGGVQTRFQLDDIEVTLNTVPTEQSTWGRIKALYED